VDARATLIYLLRHGEVAQADPRRFIYLGATSLPSRVCVAWHTAGVKTLDDLFTHELIVAAAAGTSLSIVPTVLNHVLQTRFRIVEGYKGIPDSILAVERVVDDLLVAGPEAVRAAKRLIRERPQAETTAHVAAALRTSPEGQEGLRAFLEKRAATLSSGAAWGVYSGEREAG